MRCRLQLVRLSALLLAMIALAGCQGLNPGANSIAQLRIINATPDAGLIDAYQNNAALAYNLSFGTVTSYIAMAPGPYTLTMEHAGTRQTLTTAATTLAPGRQYTVVAGNIAAAMQETVLLDQSQPAPAGQVAVRLINESVRPGPVDAYLLSPHGRVSSATPLATRLTFGASSGYINLRSGTYTLTVVPSGSQTTLASSPLILFSGPKIAYPTGTVRTLVLIDAPLTPGDPRPGVQVLMASDVDPS